ncbi:MAG: DUF1569 domain-containing protein [Gemmataceae bacterium]
MPQRQLSFNDLSEAVAEVERLHRGGYEKLGNWDLAQICDHLTYFARGSLDGQPFRVPWLFKALFGRMVLRRILTQKRMKTGVFTPQKPLPAPGGDESAAVAHFRETMERVRNHTGEFHPSPFFGAMTRDEVRALTCIHCAHHLGFLQPKSA